MLNGVAETDPWRPLSILQRSIPISLAISALRGSGPSEANGIHAKDAQTTLDLRETSASSSLVQKPAAPASLVVGGYDQPRPWRYVRWRKANERQILPPSGQKEDQPKGNCVYKVLPGEGLSDVAVKFDTYTEVLAEANKILNPQNVAIGQLLWVPKTHLIKRGNTLWSLSRRYGVSIASIQKANGIENPDLIFAGDILVIPEDLD